MTLRPVSIEEGRRGIVKAISLIQPWASLIACGHKKIETRSWATAYRGPIAIHASQTRNRESRYYESLFRGLLPGNPQAGENPMPRGQVIAIAELSDCLPTSRVRPSGKEIEFGDFGPGRFAWILRNVSPITPVPAKGSLLLWDWKPRACFRCGCDEAHACIVETGAGPMPCWWVLPGLCSNPKCLATDPRTPLLPVFADGAVPQVASR